MTLDAIILRLKATNRRAVGRATGIPHGYLSKVIYGEIKNPGVRRMDVLRSYFEAQDKPQ